MNTYGFPHNRARGLLAITLAAVVALSACSSSPGAKVDAGRSSTSSPAATVPTSATKSPGPTATAPSTHGATGSPTQAPVKLLVHYSVAATHQCSWKVGTDGHLTISIGFKITATGKNPPAAVPFEITDDQVKATGYQPVGEAFQAVLDSGKPLAGNSWVGRIVTLKATALLGTASVAHTTITLNGPIKGVASGDTYCPADKR